MGGVRGGGRTFTTLHDVGFEDYPELYDPLSRWYHKFSARLAVRNAYHIFTVSEFSKERIVENYSDLSLDPSPSPGEGRLSDKVTVTHLGIEILSPPLADQNDNEKVLEKYDLKKQNYILYVGRLEPKKNILNIVRAYEMTELEMSLVLAGRKINIGDTERYLAGKPKIRQKIIFLDYISESDKVALYHGASIFLFPTLYEGFGLPILEAQAAGVPVITSNTASNAEIAGEGAIIVDPESPYEISQAIKRLLSDDVLKSDKIRRGYENVKRFSWEECARRTLVKLLTSPQPSPQ